MTTHTPILHKTMTMILVAGALAGAVLPAASAWACGPYGAAREAPKPDHAQTWMCQTQPHAGASGDWVVDMMHMSTEGGEGALWTFSTATVPAEDAASYSFDGFGHDVGLASWSPDALHIQMYGRSVVMTPSYWSRSVVNAELHREYREDTLVNTFTCRKVR